MAACTNAVRVLEFHGIRRFGDGGGFGIMDAASNEIVNAGEWHGGGTNAMRNAPASRLESNRLSNGLVSECCVSDRLLIAPLSRALHLMTSSDHHGLSQSGREINALRDGAAVRQAGWRGVENGCGGGAGEPLGGTGVTGKLLCRGSDLRRRRPCNTAREFVPPRPLSLPCAKWMEYRGDAAIPRLWGWMPARALAEWRRSAVDRLQRRIGQMAWGGA